MNKSKLIVIGILACLALAAAGVYAGTTTPSMFSLTITAGNTLSVDIYNASHVVVSSTVPFSTTTESASCQFATGTLGTATQRITVTSLHGFTNTWTLAIAATAGTTTNWVNGGSTSTFAFNNPSGSPAGCDYGQLTLDPSVGSINLDYTGVSATTTGISKGGSYAFNTSTQSSITLMSASAAAPKTGRWYLIGVSSTQAIPAFTAASNYTLPMTLTLTTT